MQAEYERWFHFISSHRVRFCFPSDTRAVVQTGNKNGACYKENSYFALMWYMKIRGRVQSPKGTSKMRSLSASYNVIHERRLTQTLEEVPNFLNINDPAMLPTKDVSTIQTDQEVERAYLQMEEYVHRTLNEKFPPIL